MNGGYNTARQDLAVLVPNDIRRALDVGCGGGGFGRSVKAVRPDLELWGLEPVPDAADNAALTYDCVIRGFWPSDDIANEKFDMIFFNDVLEHLEDPAAALKEVGRFLAPGGRVFASIPNVRHISVMWPLVLKGRWNYADIGVLDRTHLRFFTRSTMRELFEDHGFRIVSQTGINTGISVDVQRTSSLHMFVIRVLSLLSRRRSDDFFYLQYVIVAEPPA